MDLIGLQQEVQKQDATGRVVVKCNKMSRSNSTGGAIIGGNERCSRRRQKANVNAT
jgi:hypothetical protein